MTEIPRLYLMVGLPGAGKTTAAQAIADATGAIHIWADDQRRQKFDNPSFDEAENQSLYAQLNAETAILLGQGKSVVFDTAFNHYKDRQKLRAIATAHNARALVIWVKTPSQLARQRATEKSDEQATRLLGDMSHEHFDKLKDKLEPPTIDEETIVLDGTKITKGYVMAKITNHISPH